MNYLAHGWRLVHEPFLLAGIAAPDWVRLIDKKMRLRSKTARLFTAVEDHPLACFAQGVVRHHEEDDWFHQSRAFVELNLQFAHEFGRRLPADEGFRPGFLGHIVVELLLDAVLIENEPACVDRYYAALAQVDPAEAQRCANALATQPTELLERLLPRFLAERFLYDYLDDGKLLTRLNQVLRRVGLPPLPAEFAEAFPAVREAVRARQRELLPA